MSTSAKKSVAIYGGGIAGAVLAHRLSRDFDVVLVDPHDYFEVPMAVPRNHAFAAAIEDPPASRSSLTIRSCNVPNARSMRPFACGLLAQMMSMFNANSARPNWVTPSPPTASLLFTRKMPCLSL